MNILKDAFEYLVGLGKADATASLVEEINERLYWRRTGGLVLPPSYPKVEVRTLTGLVDFLCHTTEGKVLRDLASRPMLLVDSGRRVELVGPADEDLGVRPTFAVAAMPERQPHMRYFREEHWYPHEEFMIVAPQHFDTEGDDFQRMMRYLRGVQSSDTLKNSDDGVSQTATVRRGIESLGEEKFENPVKLAPYITFPEILQPKGTYIMRMKGEPKTGLHVALFKIEDGLAEARAISRIKEYLFDKLAANGWEAPQIIG